MAGITPMQRSLDKLRKEGCYVEITEYNLKYGGKIDLLHIADILALPPDGQKPRLVQTTTSSNQSARAKKIYSHDALDRITAHFDIHVHGWYKSKRTKGWVCNVISIS